MHTTNLLRRRLASPLIRLTSLWALISCGSSSSDKVPPTRATPSEKTVKSHVAPKAKAPMSKQLEMPSISKQTDDDGWTKVIHTEFGFEASFPASPSYGREPMPGENGWTHQLQAFADKVEYDIFVKQSFATLPSDLGPWQRALILRTECNMLATGLQTPLAISEPIQTPYPGHTCTLNREDPPSTMLVEVFYARSLIFLVLATCVDDDCQKVQPSIKRFLSSFKFVE